MEVFLKIKNEYHCPNRLQPLRNSFMKKLFLSTSKRSVVVVLSLIINGALAAMMEKVSLKSRELTMHVFDSATCWRYTMQS